MLRWIVLGIIVPQVVFGWGDTGHRAIGELTERHLTPKAKREVQKLLGRESLADASLWADIIKSQPKYAFQAKWHYTNLQDGQAYKNSAKNPREDVVWAIHLMVNILKDQASHPKVENKSEALKYLVHFVEDVHQPLHAGRQIDRGGSLFYVYFFDAIYQLHRVWDSGLIQRFGLSYTELADYLQRHYEGTSIPQRSPEEWANESAKLLPYVYFFDDTFAEDVPDLISHSALLKKYPGLTDRTESKRKRPRLHFQYLNRTMSITLKRLYDASIRLANLLNTIFS